MSSEIVYLDNNATTPLCSEAAEAMKAVIDSVYGNPSSSHAIGRQAKAAVETARSGLAALLGCDASEVFFTSGGTESNNWALRGVVEANPDRKHIITSAVEHPAISEVLDYLVKTQDCEVTTLPVDGRGLVSVADFEQALRPDTLLVTIMHANNEVGALQPIIDIAAAAKAVGAVVHTDASQSVGKVPTKVDELGVDLLTVAGHKLYGPKGVGALYVRSGTPLAKFMHGANHERNRRAGTENTILVSGLGAAAAALAAPGALAANAEHCRALRDSLAEGLARVDPSAVVNTDSAVSLPNTLSIAFPGVAANTLLAAMSHRVAASAGAACHSEGVSISKVLVAMGIPEQVAMGTLRFSTGKYTTERDIASALEAVAEALASVKAAAESASSESGGGAPQTAGPYTLALGLRPRLGEFSAATVPLAEIESFYHLATVSVPANRPYVWSMTVATMDGVISFHDPGQSSAREVALKHIAGGGGECDWRLLNACWMYCDATLISGACLRDEPDLFNSPVYDDMQAYRSQVLRKEAHPIHVIVTRSGNIPLTHSLFRRSGVTVVILAPPAAAKRLDEVFDESSARAAESPDEDPAICAQVMVRAVPLLESEEESGGASGSIDFAAALELLRVDYNIHYLDICAGGVIISSLLYAGLVDEVRLTSSAQVAGSKTLSGEERPSLFHDSSSGPRGSDSNPLLVYEGIRAYGPHMVFYRARVVR